MTKLLYLQIMICWSLAIILLYLAYMLINKRGHYFRYDMLRALGIVGFQVSVLCIIGFILIYFGIVR